ncbi:hypothetical protein [Variovorax saccharolyticus]|uniref:hypothetical protein n=1 Tax=Variovorax saccharolyticus TaxID=3053516 RepID=UPI002574D128|nr:MULTISPECIES: hypothetical protein [unclassified Variovorax]MDM0022445.1 hypothetical protein [Variovorax sp. J22R187]MDM0028209.1 hypothetical protein [Variovorax sp. J31P216]
MRQPWKPTGLGLVLAALMTAAAPAFAQGPAPGAGPAKAGLDVLEGAWKRSDGNYIILIREVGKTGELTASYFNPNPLPFAKAQATQGGGTVRAAFELQAGGYGGSTYTLRYDPASDRLVGEYFQAVAKQTFEVAFSRQRTEGKLR